MPFMSHHSHHYQYGQHTNGHSAAANTGSQATRYQEIAENVAHSQQAHHHDPYRYGYPSPEEFEADVGQNLHIGQHRKPSPPYQHHHEVMRDRVTINNDVYRVMNNPALNHAHGDIHARPSSQSRQRYPPRESAGSIERWEREDMREKPFHGIASVLYKPKHNEAGQRRKKIAIQGA